jgi:hypothetical protein
MICLFAARGVFPRNEDGDYISGDAHEFPCICRLHNITEVKLHLLSMHVYMCAPLAEDTCRGLSRNKSRQTLKLVYS